MVFVQEIDRKRNPYKHTLYGGQGFNNMKLSKAYIGGLIDLSSINNFLNDNKELIHAGITTTGKIVDLGKSVSDAVNKTKEVAKIKELRAEQKKKKMKKKEEYQFTPEMEEKMKSVKGDGFAIFSTKK
jgi:hypothetical protein